MKKIIQNDVFFFFTSFFFAGAQNMISQLFFETYYPDNKVILLSLTLLFGSMMTILGIRLSSRFLYVDNKIICLLAGLSIFEFVMLILTKTFVVYILSMGGACFCLNFLFNSFDNFLNRNVSDELRAFHVKMLLAFQMSAYIVSPVFFSIFLKKKMVCLPVIIIIGTLAFQSVIRERNKNIGIMSDEQTEKKVARKEPFSKRQKIFIGFCGTTFTSIYILMACLTYVFGDYLRVKNHALVSSVFMMGLVIVSLLVVIFKGNAKDDNDEVELFAPKLEIMGMLFLIIAIGLLMVKVKVTVWFYTIPAVVFGFGYGFYLCLGRRYTNCCKTGRSLVSAYNTVQNVSSLVGYIISFLIGVVSKRTGLSSIVIDLVTAVALFVCSVLQVVMWKRAET